MRKVTVFSTKGRSKQVIETKATTWGELKKDLTEAGVSVSGVKAIVGENQNTLESSQASLPMGLQKNGTTDGDFTLFLTPVKVKSGNDKIDPTTMSYQECKEFIKKERGESDKAVEFFSSYTTKSHITLQALIMDYLKLNSEYPSAKQEMLDIVVQMSNLLQKLAASLEYYEEELPIDELQALEEQFENIMKNM